jgi:hypothetical protein
VHKHACSLDPPAVNPTQPPTRPPNHPQAPPGESVGVAAVLLRLIRRHPRLSALLEWDGGAPIGGRGFDAAAAEPSDAGALAAALWELTLAARHYHPHVAASARALLALTPGAATGGSGGDGGGGVASAGAGGLLTGAAGPQELALAYDGATRFGRFRPAPAAPRGGRGGGAAAPAPLGKARQAAAARARAAVAARPLCGELAAAIGGGGGGSRAAAPGRGKKGGRQEQQRRDAAAAAAAVAAAQGLEGDDGGEGAAEGGALEGALQQHWRGSRRFGRNAKLRAEAVLLEAKVARFREHLLVKK